MGSGIQVKCEFAALSQILALVKSFIRRYHFAWQFSFNFAGKMDRKFSKFYITKNRDWFLGACSQHPLWRYFCRQYSLEIPAEMEYARNAIYFNRCACISERTGDNLWAIKYCTL